MGGYSGFSFRIAKGVRYHIGGTRGHYEPGMKTPAQLLSQVSYCNTQLKTQYFPDEEEHIAAYLNERYYHFPP